MAESIIFIPRSPFLSSDRVLPALGPLYLKSFLEGQSHKIFVSDDLNLQSISDLERFDVIGISTTTPQYLWNNQGKNFAKKIKEFYPEKKLIIGGAHAKNYFKELLEENLFDHIVRGEGEKAYLEILNNKNLPKVISYPQFTSKEINSFPIPWRDKKYLEKYNFFINDNKATTVMTGRFCPMRCMFCEERDSKLTLYNITRVDEELDSIKKIGFNALMFYDDILPVTEKRTKELTEIIKHHDLKYRCNGHVRIMSKNTKVLDMLVNSGCVEVCLGIESTNQRILNSINKGNKVDEIFQATENILNSGLNISAYLMIGLPGESKETIKNTEEYVSNFSKNPNFSFDLTIFYPYKYTYIRENIEKFDLELHLENSSGVYKGLEGSSECCVSTSSLSQQDIYLERERIINTYKNNFRGYLLNKNQDDKS